MAKTVDIAIERLVDEEEYEWQSVKIKHLAHGDVFRMWNYNGKDWKLHEHKGKTEFKAIGNPFLHPEYGVWTVNIEDEEDEDNTEGQDRSE